ncbi:MAG: ATP-binding protein [Sphingomonadaceae bacterium]
MGQMLLAVALALFVVQGLGAFFIYRAQSERREAAMVHSVAFRLVADARGPRFEGPRGEGRRGPRIRESAVSPVAADEWRDRRTEAALARVLDEQDMPASEIVVTHREIRDDPPSLERAMRRAERFGPDANDIEGKVMVAGIRFEGQPVWKVARVRNPFEAGQLIRPLLTQTALIYLVVVAVVGLVLLRITRPLAALTRQVERFAETREPAAQVEPQGPDDIRRLITAQNAMESRIAGLLDEKDVMLGAIGHDLKTPLAALRVRIESVEDEAERAKMAATIEDIVHSLDDILSLARVGRPTDDPEQTDLAALVASVVDEYEDMGEPVLLGETQRVAMNLRPTWLRRALRNLIGNALRYGERARVSLAREGGGAVVRIEDDGPGIPESEIAAMMEPFTRGDPSRNRGTGGAGLGLALARAIAEQHGGRLVLENRAGPEGANAGLTARLELPLG